MNVLRLLSARRPHSEVPDSEPEEDEGPFFDLDFSSSSSGSESDDACSKLDFVISLHRRRSASPSYHETNLFFPPPLQFCASEPSTKAGQGLLLLQPQYKLRCTNLRRLSFGAKDKSAFYGGRPSFASSTRSLRLFMESPPAAESEPTKRGAPSGDVIRRCLTMISRRLRSVRPRPAGEARGLHRRLRKSRSASAAVTLAPSMPPSRRNDSLIEKQDGIAGAIAHCKESFHRASLSSECDSSLLRSRSDPGKCEASS